jgi:molybdate transport system ATP-binding protein
VTALFGPSGSGKSTVLAIVAGLMRPQGGRVVLDGVVLLDTAGGVEVAAERRRCGVVFQDARLLPHLSVAANLRYGARRAPRDAPRDAGRDTTAPGFEEVVALLGIEALLGRRPRDLSGGEKQRVALGRALLSRPRLLLMDEPLAALDAPRRAEIMPFLEGLRDGGGPPIVYVTHALDEVDRLADTLVLMEAGRVSRHDAGRGLTELAFEGGVLSVPLRMEAVGRTLRLRLRARDVALATTRPEGISTHNVLPGVVMAIGAAGAHEAFVTVQVGGTAVLARLTRDAVGRLGLEPGRQVYALVKSTAFDHG